MALRWERGGGWRRKPQTRSASGQQQKAMMERLMGRERRKMEKLSFGAAAETIRRTCVLLSVRIEQKGQRGRVGRAPRTDKNRQNKNNAKRRIFHLFASVSTENEHVVIMTRSSHKPFSPNNDERTECVCLKFFIIFSHPVSPLSNAFLLLFSTTRRTKASSERHFSRMHGA